MGFEIKICGLKTLEALDAALAAGADMVGFVHFPRSPRHLALAAAPALSAHARGRALRVALVVDADDALLADVIAALDPDLLQLHGHEAPERVAEVRARFGRPVMKALPVAVRADLDRVGAYAAASDRLLFDAKPAPGAALPGGNGRTFDWGLIRGLDAGRPVMLSGGLDAGNVAEAVAATGVGGVDVSSGVESAPGVKSPEKIHAFVAAARRAKAGAAETLNPSLKAQAS
ncbi:phosphoribosylanthranilate isomerase [Xanthobacter sp. V4C-4]|uniref:phosphoribosylanthranilate isomerase n=1 Tax=Xanthobacter cornucopiae TaxID=3119924 RepID=UPI00372A2E30